MFEEIFNSIKSHKTRSILTGLGITWGVLILILLVGLGKGFEDGVMKLFNGFARKTMYVFTGQTTKPYKAYPAGRKIYFSGKDMADLPFIVPGIKDISRETSRNMRVANEDKVSGFEVKGVDAAYFRIKLLHVSYGRVIDNLDFSEIRKVALIGEDVAKYLFSQKNAVGKSISIGGINFTVTGIIKDNLFNSFESRLIYVPYSAYTNYIDKKDQTSLIMLSIADGSDSRKVEDRIRSLMGARDNFSPNDEKVLFFNSLDEQLKAFSKFFSGLKKFLWFMGLSTLLSGIIGVANIMYSVAKERTREIGIRKAIGARKRTIMQMFVAESIVLTSMAGYIGIITGAMVLKLISYLMESSNSDTIFEKPGIDLGITCAATIILITAGTIAGLVPAAFAAKLNPVDALKQE